MSENMRFRVRDTKENRWMVDVYLNRGGELWQERDGVLIPLDPERYVVQFSTGVKLSDVELFEGDIMEAVGVEKAIKHVETMCSLRENHATCSTDCEQRREYDIYTTLRTLISAVGSTWIPVAGVDDLPNDAGWCRVGSAMV